MLIGDYRESSVSYRDGMGWDGFWDFSRFFNRCGRFDFFMNKVYPPERGVPYRLAEIYPSPPSISPHLNFFFSKMSPPPKYSLEIREYISSNGQYYRTSISTSTVFPIYGTPLGLSASTHYVDISSPKEITNSRESSYRIFRQNTYPKTRCPGLFFFKYSPEIRE